MSSNLTSEYKVIADKIVSPDEDIIVQVTGAMYKDSVTEDNRYTVASELAAVGNTNLLSVATNIVPATDNTYSLGTTDKRWESLHIGPGTLYITDQTLGTDAEITVDDGVFNIDGIAQAQLANVRVTNLTFNDNSVQTTAPGATSTSFNPQFTDASGTLAGVTATASYTMIGTICFFRVYVDFNGYTNLGTGQYQITLPFASVSTMTQRSGHLHNESTSSLYHIAGIVDSESSDTVMKFYYSGSTTDLAWKYNTPVSWANNTTHFDISGIYQVA
jgi:hypothetical protein